MVGDDSNVDLDLVSSDDIASDDAVRSDDVIRSDDYCEGNDQSEKDTEETSSSDANRFDQVFVPSQCYLTFTNKI